MDIVQDYKGRYYRVIEETRGYTVLKCLKTGDRVQILKNDRWFYEGRTFS